MVTDSGKNMTFIHNTATLQTDHGQFVERRTGRITFPRVTEDLSRERKIMHENNSTEQSLPAWDALNTSKSITDGPARLPIVLKSKILCEIQSGGEHHCAQFGFCSCFDITNMIVIFHSLRLYSLCAGGSVDSPSRWYRTTSNLRLHLNSQKIKCCLNSSPLFFDLNVRRHAVK